MIADVEEGLGRDKMGGIRLGGRKVKVLGYTDDNFGRGGGGDEMVIKKVGEIFG